MKRKFLLVYYWFLLALYSLWSWTQVHPNLYFATFPPYVAAQNWLQEIGITQRPLVSIIYLCLMIALFAIYLQLLDIPIAKNTPPKSLRQVAIFVLPLLFAFNALSSDVFNYIFNAKMVLVYHDNPHIHTAMDYQTDDLTRFMHNVHTPAPYGYGWTLLSLLPYNLALGKFSLQWLSFRLVNVLFLLATVWSLWYWHRLARSPVDKKHLTWWALNPLILIEMIGNHHNDLWMILPALWSLILVWPRPGKRLTLKRVTGSLALLTLSASIKYATVILIPAWCYLAGGQVPQIKNWWHDVLKRINNHWSHALSRFANHYFFDLCALAMFIPLLTSRAQRFHPWYLSWALVFWPLCRHPRTHTAMLILSVSAMLRYLPYLWFHEYTDAIILSQQIITLLPVTVYAAAIMVTHFASPAAKKRKS